MNQPVLNLTERGAQARLAKEAGVTRQAVHRWVVGLNKPSLATIMSLTDSPNPETRKTGLTLLHCHYPGVYRTMRRGVGRGNLKKTLESIHEY